MTPVTQTIFRPPTGNCLAACVASLVEMPLWLVPNFSAEDRWIERDGKWVCEGSGFLWWKALAKFALERDLFVTLLLQDKAEGWACKWPSSALAIATIHSPRGSWLHSVVARPGIGTVAWDPNPKGMDDGELLPPVIDWLILGKTT